MRGTVVFDLDGTLADTAGDLIASANAVLSRRGLNGLDPVADAPVAFAGGRAMLRTGYARASAAMLIPPGAEDEDFPLLLDAYENAIAVHTRLYPGVEDALTALADHGHILTVCTNKPEGLAEKLLRELGIRDAFSALIGADTLPVRKPDPSPYREAVHRAGGDVARSFLLGDTVTDVKTAAAAGVRVALVAFGPEGQGISRLKPDAMLAHFDDLPALARDWLG
ncbi:HAD-IA family hydrolase [Paracoccus sp. SCSIO 75233]|uniref:HAD-IA family hydrolase n=1 Tax=Paracoccus sp. SCSIO 75233 TaxID=3017782 RepID=UPI0022F071CC|nr:HAD-IA family hydrolase [Paracoccus sp. SCSIO 75233]WBU53524.1 HAD-IA family hydrolase [Paracoccus sp. SCSIO 75233]